MKLPNFFIVGAAKAGTTSLYAYLSQHPDIYMSPIKEPNYFSSDIVVADFTRDYADRMLKNEDADTYIATSKRHQISTIHVSDWEQYCRLFTSVLSQKAVGEASVSYLYSKTAAINIKNKICSAKIVIILRNPIDRAYSHYLMDLQAGLTFLSLKNAIDTDQARTKKGWGASHLYVELGLYYEQVKRFIDVFGAEKVKIYLYEDLVNERGPLIRDLFRFLGVNEDFSPDLVVHHNKGLKPRFARLNYYFKKSRMIRNMVHSTTSELRTMLRKILVDEKSTKISPEDRRYLKPYFADDVRELSRLLNRNLSGWIDR
jgi:hypothetical protein